MISDFHQNFLWMSEEVFFFKIFIVESSYKYLCYFFNSQIIWQKEPLRLTAGEFSWKYFGPSMWVLFKVSRQNSIYNSGSFKKRQSLGYPK